MKLREGTNMALGTYIYEAVRGAISTGFWLWVFFNIAVWASGCHAHVHLHGPFLGPTATENPAVVVEIPSSSTHPAKENGTEVIIE